MMRMLFWPRRSLDRASRCWDGGATPFKGQKAQTWEGGYRSPAFIRLPQGDELKKKIEKDGAYGFVKITLDGVK